MTESRPPSPATPAPATPAPATPSSATPSQATPSQATRAERFSWCLFDFANSAFNTIVVTFVYVTFFTGVLVGDQERGDLYWSRSLAVAGLAIAVISPILGTLADRTAHKKLYLVVLSGITIACTAALFLPQVAPGQAQGTAGAVWAALVLFTLANISFELMFVFYNAFLPGLGSAQTIGRLSGYGWALGYGGGLLSLVVCLGCVGVGDFEPWLPAEDDLNVRATNLVVAGWFAVFALPMFLLVRDRSGPAPAGVGHVGGGGRGPRAAFGALAAVVPGPVSDCCWPVCSTTTPRSL